MSYKTKYKGVEVECSTMEELDVLIKHWRDSDPRCRARWVAGMLQPPDDLRRTGDRCILDKAHEGDHAYHKQAKDSAG